MGFNTGKRNGIGPRFGELMGKHCHAALTAANRQDRAGYDKEIADIYQMLDTIEQETDWGDKDGTAKVAAASKPAPKSAGNPKKSKKGSAAPKRASGNKKDSNDGPTNDGGSEPTGDAA